MRSATALVLLLLAGMVAAAELVLPPAGSVTIVDAADPAVRIVITAPPNAPLDLTPLLSIKPGESVYSIVTSLQSQQSSGMRMNDDGSVSLSGPAASPRRLPTPGLAGGVLIRQGANWHLRPGTPPAAGTEGAPAAAAQSPKATIFKPGATKDEAERDIVLCRARAEEAATQHLRPADRVQAYNSTMYACIRALGYEVRT